MLSIHTPLVAASDPVSVARGTARLSPFKYLSYLIWRLDLGTNRAVVACPLGRVGRRFRHAGRRVGRRPRRSFRLRGGRRRRRYFCGATSVELRDCYVIAM